MATLEERVKRLEERFEGSRESQRTRWDMDFKVNSERTTALMALLADLALRFDNPDGPNMKGFIDDVKRRATGDEDSHATLLAGELLKMLRSGKARGIR